MSDNKIIIAQNFHLSLGLTTVINKLVEQSGIEIVTNKPKNSVTAYKAITSTTVQTYEIMANKFKTHKLHISVLHSSQNRVAAVEIIAAKAAVIVMKIKINNILIPVSKNF
jgi:hypothetical protein